MKYKKLLLLFFIIIILLGGCNVNSDFDDETVTKLKSVTESYIKNNFQQIESIEMGDPYIAEMGATMIDGTVNNQAGFSIILNEDYTVASIGTKEGFPDTKEECKNKVCDY